MRIWKPAPNAVRWIGIALLAILSVASGYLIWQLGLALVVPPEQWAIDLPLFGQFVLLMVLLAVISVLGYRLAAALTLRYTLDRNGLYITWLGNRAVVPLEQVLSIEPAAPVAYLPISVQLAQAAGSYWGEARAADQPLHMYATQPPDQCLCVLTAGAAYAISPADREAFVLDLEQRRNLGAVKPLAAAVETGPVFFYAYWSDPIVRRALGIALVLNLALLGYIAARYPELPALLALRFDAAGRALGETLPRHQILFIPLAGLLTMLINMVVGLVLYGRETFAARLMQLASILLQLLFLVAAASILR